jgi:hypothetical protein
VRCGNDLCAVEKRQSRAAVGYGILSVQPLARGYTDCAVATHSNKLTDVSHISELIVLVLVMTGMSASATVSVI